MNERRDQGSRKLLQLEASNITLKVNLVNSNNNTLDSRKNIFMKPKKDFLKQMMIDLTKK